MKNKIHLFNGNYFNWTIILFFLILFYISFASAENVIIGQVTDSNNPDTPIVIIQQPSSVQTNVSYVVTNNSIYWGGRFNESDLNHNSLGGLQGGEAGEYYHLNQSMFDRLVTYIYSWITGSNVAYTNQSNNFTGNQNVNGNVTVNGTINGTFIGSLDQTSFMPIYAGIQQDPYGFDNPTGTNAGINANITFNNTSKTLTISGNYSYWFNGTQYFKNGNDSDSVVVPVTSSGLYYIYFVGPNLTANIITGLQFVMQEAAVSVIYWSNNTQTALIVEDEKHGHIMPGIVHAYLHQFLGTRYVSGLSPQNITTGGSGNVATDAQLSFSDGAIQDEDYQHLINVLPFPAQIRVFYQIGPTGNWSVKEGDNFPMIYSGDSTGYVGANGRLPYNFYNGSIWSLIQTPNTDYILIHFFATNEVNNSKSIFAIQGQNEYTTLANAQAGVASEINSIVTTGLPMAEAKALATVVVETANAYGNVPQARFRLASSSGASFIDWRQSLQTGTSGNLGGTVTLVNSGTGLTGGPITSSGTLSIDNSYIQQFNDSAFLLNFTNFSFVPYVGAITNVNLGLFNLSAANLLIPSGGAMNFRSENYSNDSYMSYNPLTKRVELWANGKLQQDWGNSTTIYGTATFQANAFFQNLSGNALLISANVLVDGNLTANNIFAGNICYSDGTNCTAFNSTINASLANITALILAINQTLSVQIAYLANTTFNNTNGPYLYNANQTIYFNETKLNQTITTIANVNAFQQSLTVNVVGGTGFNISTPINYYLTQLIVTAPTNTSTFNFQATQNNASGFMIDKNRLQHIGQWNILEAYSLTNDTLYLNISNASVDGTYTVLIKYINSKFTYP